MAVVKLFIQHGADPKQCLGNDPSKSAHQLVPTDFYDGFPKKTKELQELLASLNCLIVDGFPPAPIGNLEGQADRHPERQAKATQFLGPNKELQQLPMGHYTNEMSVSHSLPERQRKRWTQKLLKLLRSSTRNESH